MLIIQLFLYLGQAHLKVINLSAGNQGRYCRTEDYFLRILSVFQQAWLVRNEALNLPLTLQLVHGVFRAGLGFSSDGSRSQSVPAADSEGYWPNT